MTEASCEWARSAETLADYFGGELSPELEAALEAHYFECSGCGDLVARAATLVGGVRRTVRTEHVLSVVSRGLVERLRSEGVAIAEFTAEGTEVHARVDRSAPLMIARLPGDFAGARRVDVRWYNEWDGSVQEELGVRLDREDEVVIACGSRAFADASGVLRSRCEVSAADAPERRVLASFQLVLDAG